MFLIISIVTIMQESNFKNFIRVTNLTIKRRINMTFFSELKLISGCWYKGKTISQWLYLQGSKMLSSLVKKRQGKKKECNTQSLNETSIYTHSWINVNVHLPTEKYKEQLLLLPI